MTEPLRIHLDRTLCDGFGACAKHAPAYFSLDDWGYACLVGDGTIPDVDRHAVMRALMDCPVHAIMKLGDRRPDDAQPINTTAAFDEDPAAHLKTEDNEAEWGFIR